MGKGDEGNRFNGGNKDREKEVVVGEGEENERIRVNPCEGKRSTGGKERKGEGRELTSEEEGGGGSFLSFKTR